MPGEELPTANDELDAQFTSTTTTTAAPEHTTADLNIGPERMARARAEAGLEAAATNDRVYPTGITTPISAARECAQLCEDNQEWCLGFVVQHTLTSSLVCHQLKVLRLAYLDPDVEAAADSFDLVKIDTETSPVKGSYFFEGNTQACQQRCSASPDCEMVITGPGFCAAAEAVATTNVAPSSIHPLLAVSSQAQRFRGASPGSNKKYCVAATNPADYDERGYFSTRVCDYLTIAWESVIRGQVVIDSDEIHLPVEGVTVHATLGSAFETTIVTGEDGVFEIHVLSKDIKALRQSLTLSYSKRSGDVSHTFECGGVACTQQTVIIEHLRFDQEIEVRDTTSVPFSGRVTIAGTEHEGYYSGCPLRGVEVCLYDRLHGSRVLGCADTDAQGYYTAAAVLGSSVTVGLRYGNSSHVFDRTPFEVTAPNAPSGFTVKLDLGTGQDKRVGYYDITETKVWSSIDFQDITTDTATVDVAGGQCNFTLGNAILEFRYDSCPTWVRTEQSPDRISKWRLPAQIISVRFQRLVRGGEVREEMTRYFSATLGDSRIIHVDLRNPQNKNETIKTARFEYHPPPQLEVMFNTELSTDCEYGTGEQKPMRVIGQNLPTNATIKITEDYGEGVGVCDIVPGTLEVENQLGESPKDVALLQSTGQVTSDETAARLKRCYKPCEELPVEMDTTQGSGGSVLSNTHVTLQIQTGGPQLNPQSHDKGHPFTKLFVATMHNLPHDPVSERVLVVVTGQHARSAGDSITIPRFNPLLVVQDPPGGMSTASHSNTYANVLVEHKEWEAYKGFFLGFEETPFKVCECVSECACAHVLVCVCVIVLELFVFVESFHCYVIFFHFHSWAGQQPPQPLLTSLFPRLRTCNQTKATLSLCTGIGMCCVLLSLSQMQAHTLCHSLTSTRAHKETTLFAF